MQLKHVLTCQYTFVVKFFILETPYYKGINTELANWGGKTTIIIVYYKRKRNAQSM